MSAAVQRLITAISAGLIAGIRTILGSAAMVALIMPPSLGGGIAQGIEVLLIGGAVLAALVAVMSTYPGTVAQVQDGPAVILGVMATALAASMQGHAPPEAVVTLALACANVTAIAAGMVFYGLGAYRLGALVRFIPYPVIGGFLAGSGLLILMGAGRVLTGIDFSDASLGMLLEPARAARWMPGLAFGIALVLVLRRSSHVLLVPAMLIGGVLLYHAAVAASGMRMADAESAGWLLGPFPEGGGLAAPAWSRLPADGWRVMATQLPTFAAILLVSIVALLLNATGLELATRGELDIDRELRATGIANMSSGLLGGTVGFHALSASLLGFRMGANSRLIGLTAAAMCAIALFAGSSLLAFVPKAVLGGLLVSMGAGLLVEWLYDGWRRLPLQDYLIVAVIVTVIGSVGILPGVAVGIGFAMAIFVLNCSRVRVVRQELTGADFRSSVDRSPAALDVLKAKGGSIRVVQLEGFIFFGTAYTLLTQLRQILSQPANERAVRFLILDFQDVPASDSSAMSAFSKLYAYCHRDGCELVFTRMNHTIERQLRQAGLDPQVTEVRFFEDLDFAMEYCEERILSDARNSAVPPNASIWDQIAAAMPRGTPFSSFMAYLHPRKYEAGEPLLHQGGVSTEIVFIESGRVTVSLAMPDGRSIRLRALTMGTMIGEIGLYLNQPRSASAIADVPTQAYILTSGKLREMEQNDPALANALHFVIVTLVAKRLAGTTGLLQRLVS